LLKGILAVAFGERSHVVMWYDHSSSRLDVCFVSRNIVRPVRPQSTLTTCPHSMGQQHIKNAAPDAMRAERVVLTERKPFDGLVEGLFQKRSGEDRTPIELFIAAVRDWEVGLRRRLESG